MSKNIHRSEELDKYLGQVVKITFIDDLVFNINKEIVGVLGYGAKYNGGYYNINEQHHFRKTHVKKVEPYIHIKTHKRR